MSDTVSTILKTESDSTHPPSKFKQKYILSNARPIMTKKLTSNKKISIPNQRDMWKQMFGNFLHDINLKTKKTEASSETKQHLQDPLVNQAPILLPCSDKHFKLEFYKYLEGQQDVHQLLQSMNFPNLKAKAKEQQLTLQRQISIVQKIKKFRGGHNQYKTGDQTPQLDMNSSVRSLRSQQVKMVDQRRFTEAARLLELFRNKINKKMQVLRDFIQQRIDLRKSLNKEQREEEIRNIHFIKTFFDITNDYHQHLKEQQEELQDDAHYFRKQIPCQKKLKQILINYDNLKPIIKHQERTLDKYDCPSTGILKKQMNELSKEYLVELEMQKKISFKTALHQVRRLLEQQNIKFQSDIRKSRIKSIGNSKSQSPLYVPQNQGNKQVALDVLVATPRHKKQNSSQSQLKDLSDFRKRKDYVITKKPFYLFTKTEGGEKNIKNSKGLITNYDVKLYDYIHNRNIYNLSKQTQDITQKFHEIIESEQEQQNNFKLEMKLNQMKNQQMLQKRQKQNLELHKRVKTEKVIDEQYSDDQSLQSIYEVNLDVLYDQSHQLSNKLKEQNEGGFAKRIKQLIKLEEVNTQCLKTNLSKLNKSNALLKIE